jgi:hypothetical protein
LFILIFFLRIFLENVIVNLLLTLRDWLLAAPNDILTLKSDKPVILKVFASLEMTLLGDMVINGNNTVTHNTDGFEKCKITS